MTETSADHAPHCPFSELAIAIEPTGLSTEEVETRMAGVAGIVSLLSKTAYSRIAGNVAITAQQQGVGLLPALRCLVERSKIGEGVMTDIFTRLPHDLFRTCISTTVESIVVDPLTATATTALLVGMTDAAIGYAKDVQTAKALGIIGNNAASGVFIAKDLAVRTGLSAVGTAIFCAAHRASSDYVKQGDSDRSFTFKDDMTVAAFTGITTGLYAAGSGYVTNQALIDGAMKLDHFRPDKIMRHIATKPALVTSMALSIGMAAYAKSQSDRLFNQPVDKEADIQTLLPAKKAFNTDVPATPAASVVPVNKPDYSLKEFSAVIAAQVKISAKMSAGRPETSRPSFADTFATRNMQPFGLAA